MRQNYGSSRSVFSHRDAEVVKSGEHISKTFNIVSTGNHNHFAICSLFIISDPEKFFYDTLNSHTYEHKINCNVLHNAHYKLHVVRSAPKRVRGTRDGTYDIAVKTKTILHSRYRGRGETDSSWCVSETTHQTRFPFGGLEGNRISSLHDLRIHSKFSMPYVPGGCSVWTACHRRWHRLASTSKRKYVRIARRKIYIFSVSRGHAAPIFHITFTFKCRKWCSRLDQPGWHVHTAHVFMVTFVASIYPHYGFMQFALTIIRFSWFSY